MQTNLDQLALAWYEQTLPIPDLAAWAAPEFREIALQNARLDIGRELIGLAEGRSLPTECPPEIVVSAELAVNTGYPLWAALQAYRTGHAIQWKAWSDAVERRTNRREDRRLLLEAGSDYMFAYADRASRWVEIAYTRLRDQQLRSSEQRRIQLVRDILAGEDPEPRELGYELDRWHLGVIASGLEAEAIVRELALKTSADLLSLAADGSNSWMWLGFPTIAAGRGSLSTVHAPTDGGVALGDPAFGVAGFVETHQQAQRAAVIGGVLHRPICSYRDISLEDLASADDARARTFVERELQGLARHGTRAEKLRATLHAYFAAAQTASAAAHLLGVHERTVGNRLRQIETIIGGSVVSRRAEIETALRLHALLKHEDHAHHGQDARR